jgi:transglutaminase-like putative cysteine protease
LVGNTRVGYAQTTIRPVPQNGRLLVRIEGLTRLTTQRDGAAVTVELGFWCLETPEGRLIEFESTTPAMRFRGQVVAEQLHVTTTSAGRTEQAVRPWPNDYRGFLGPQQALWQAPMQPGQQRTVWFLDPSTCQAASIAMVARDYEPVPLLHETRTLLRIDTTMTLAGQVLAGAVWTDSSGEILKTWTDLLQTQSYRTTRAEALTGTSPGDLDLIRSIAIPVARPLLRPHDTRRVRYRVRLEGANPAEVFVSSSSQRVKPIDPHTAEITVYAVRPGVRGNPAAPDAVPTEADRAPSSLVESDDPKIVAAAQKVPGTASDPWQTALALERLVYEAIADKSYTQAFDSAAAALASGRGDCTEHAVLLTALARAKGIPARAAIGLVYVEQKFLYHMWTEVYLSGQWIGLDATRARAGTSGAYLTLAHTSLETASAYASLLPVARVAGKLTIEILDTE